MTAMETLDRVKILLEQDINGDAVSHKMLLEEVHKLQLTVELPHDTAMRVRFQPMQNIAVIIALEYGILQAVAKRSGQPVTARELSQETPADEGIIERLMRLICWMGYCNDDGERTYRSNGTTMHVCTPGGIGGEKIQWVIEEVQPHCVALTCLPSTEVILPIGGKAVEMMRTQGFHPLGGNGVKDPCEYTHGVSQFEMLERNEELKNAFDDYMAARRTGTQLQWFDIWPVQAYLDRHPIMNPDEVQLCDVGGGQGHEVVKYHAHFPDKRGRLVVQDLACTFHGVSLPAGIEVMAHDFFDPQPVRGARIYYMRQVMHDWPDEQCRQILSHIVSAMNKDSRLLIDDYIMPSINATSRVIHMDITMMIYSRSEERTQSRWESLISSAGLELVHIYTPPTALESIIETKLPEH